MSARQPAPSVAAAESRGPSLDAAVLEELKRLAEEADSDADSRIFTGKPAKIDERAEKARRQKIENDNREKDQRLKEATLRLLFTFLGIETAVIFSLAFLQGFANSQFRLDQWSFRLVITATLGQITAMLTIAVRHLFPQNRAR